MVKEVIVRGLSVDWNLLPSTPQSIHLPSPPLPCLLPSSLPSRLTGPAEPVAEGVLLAHYLHCPPDCRNDSLAAFLQRCAICVCVGT